MPAFALAPHQLRLTIDPTTLGFASTAELQDLPLPWIGQERAQAAAQFGLAMQQPDYHLFVLGEVGSGRASLMRQAMKEAAAGRVPPGSELLPSEDGYTSVVLVKKRALVTGEMLTDAQQSFDQQSGQPVVSFRFNSAGARRFAAPRASCPGR